MHYQDLYQLEVKYLLVKFYFPPNDGWKVLVDIDPMEKARGNQHKPDKKPRVKAAKKGLTRMGVKIGADPIYGRMDIYAEHSEKGVRLI